MTAETMEAKARQLLVSGKVRVTWCSPGLVCGVVEGDHGVYDIDLHSGRWSCSCEARTTCSHLRAVWLVTVPDVSGFDSSVPRIPVRARRTTVRSPLIVAEVGQKSRRMSRSDGQHKTQCQEVGS